MRESVIAEALSEPQATNRQMAIIPVLRRCMALLVCLSLILLIYNSYPRHSQLTTGDLNTQGQVDTKTTGTQPSNYRNVIKTNGQLGDAASSREMKERKQEKTTDRKEKGSGTKENKDHSQNVLDTLMNLSAFKKYVNTLKEGLDELFFVLRPAALGVPEVEGKVSTGLQVEEFTKIGESALSSKGQLRPSARQRAYGLHRCPCTRMGPEVNGTGHVLLHRQQDGQVFSRRVEMMSSCSQYSTARGPGQKVVAYSYYGKTSKPAVYDRYFSEIPRRAAEIREHYPGWVMRVYYKLDPDDKTGWEEICTSFCTFPNLDLCDVTNLPAPWDNLEASQKVGTLWRFVAFADPLVDVVLSRDLDSYILPREEAAVREWLESSSAFHLMRDHPSHNGYILAGLWGGRLSLDRAATYQDIAVLLSQPQNDLWDYDQRLLARVVWPRIKDNVMSHDSYTCRVREFQGRQTHPRPFPTRRDGRNYTGFGRTKKAVAKSLRPCPQACRPYQHQDWLFC